MDIAVFDRLELLVDNSVTKVEFIYTDGTKADALPFLYQPISFEYDNEGLEIVKKSGTIHNCVRFTPTHPGTLKAVIYSNEQIINEEIFNVLPSDNFGYVKISSKDKRYFKYTNGKTFFPIGINMAFPSSYPITDNTEFGQSKKYAFMGLRQYERWFKKSSENGVNMVRIWLGHEYFSPDTENACEFDLVQFSKIDALLKLAKKYDLKLKLTIDQFRYFDYERDASGSSYADDIFRKFNKRLYEEGEACRYMTDWLENWGRSWLSKISELSKRYSGDTSIFAVELWNEMNAVSAPFDAVLKWNKKYLDEVKKLFPYNMVVNSLGSLDCDGAEKQYNSFCWDKSDFKQIHRYLDQGAKFESCTKNPIESITEAFNLVKPENQPVLLAETGAVNNCHSGPFKYYSCDDEGMIFADSVFTPVFCGSCGCGNIWHWDERYVESKNLYHLYKPLTKLLNGVDMASEEFVTKDLSNDKAYILILEGKTHILGYIRNKSSDWQNLFRDLKEKEVIEELVINNIKNTEIIDIWNDAKTYSDGNKIMNIGHGVFIKARR